MAQRALHIPSLRTRLASVSVLALAACGGSGGGDAPANPPAPPVATPMQVSGTVATSAALADAAVVVTCARGSGSTTSNEAGAYTQKLDDAQLPCVVTATSADGTTVLHSIAGGTASADTTIEVTPLTELLVAQYAGAAPSLYVANFGATTKVDATSLQQAQTTLLQSLAHANVDLSGVTDVVSGALQPGSASGYDAALQHLSASMTDAGTSLGQLTTTVATTAGMGGNSSQSTLATQLAVANADCPSLRSGTHRSIDFGDLSTNVFTVDARALTAVIEGVTRHLTPIDTCLYQLDDQYNTQIAISKSGMGVWRQGSSGIDDDVGMTFPEQTLDMAALAGTYNRVSYAGTAIDSGDFGSEAFDANGKHTAHEQCAGGYGTCAAETDIHAHLEVDASGGFDYYDETDDVRSIDARVFGFRDANGRTWAFALTDQAVLILAPQAALTAPAVGSTSNYWNVDASSTGVSALVPDADTTTAFDAATNTATRQFASDGHTDTMVYNDPAPGLRHRTVNACLTADNAPDACRAVVQMPLAGAGITAVVSADPTKHFISLSVGKPQ